VLELLAGVRGQGDIGVEREPFPPGAAELLSVHHRGGGAQPAHGLAGAGAGGDPLLDRGGGVAGQQRHLLGHGIGGAGVVGQAPGPPEQARQARVELLQDLGDLRVGGGGQRVEDRARARRGTAEDAIEHEGVERPP
jgi:hypothetical protein